MSEYVCEAESMCVCVREMLIEMKNVCVREREREVEMYRYREKVRKNEKCRIREHKHQNILPLSYRLQSDCCPTA